MHIRKRSILILLFLGLVVIAALASQETPGATTAARRWYKGNLHTHTLNSDGDSTPLEVATWYRERGYHFLVLTDHNYLTDVSILNGVVGAKERFRLIVGEEVTDSFQKKPLHINGFNLRELVPPQHGHDHGGGHPKQRECDPARRWIAVLESSELSLGGNDGGHAGGEGPDAL